MNANRKEPAGDKSSKKGLWVYCIRHLIDGGNKELKGIQPGAHARFLPFRDMEIAVSGVDIEQFNERTLKEKLENDAKWTEISVRLHHKIIEEVGKNSEVVIPMKFGTIYKTRKNLEAMLKKYYAKFKELIERLKNKQEWGVKAHLEYKKFAELLKRKNKEIKKLEKKRSSVPEGMKWYIDRKSDELVAAQHEKEVEKCLQHMVKQLEKYAEEVAFNDLLPKEVNEPGRDNVLNAACLVKNDNVDKFQDLLQELQKEYDPMGITLIITGPWPPYNFVDIKNE